MSELNNHASIELINIVPFNPLISKCQIKVCWVGYQPNRNKSIITKDVAKEMANTLPGSPIVGYYNESTGDFEEHNKIIELSGGKFKLVPTTKPYGFVDLNAKVWFEWFLDKDGITREYLVTEGWLWTGQFPECERVITKGNNQSMELDENMIDAYWTKDANGNKEFFIINEAIISKLCILGEEFEPCFEGGSITAPKLEFSFEEDFKQRLFSMMSEIKNILNEGGANMDENMTPVVEEPVVEEPVVETPDVEDSAEPAAEPVVEEPAVETEPEIEEEPVVEDEDDSSVAEESDKVTYVLEEVTEYVEPQTSYAELETKFNELTSAHEALKAENAALVEFKAGVDRKEKEALIASFYMLSDELKQEVKDNIDSYSLDDIEAKLSILCVRNKVSFDLENDKEVEPVTYSLASEGSSNSNAPEWIKAILDHVTEN